MPFRLDIAGGWLDQPFISKYHPGPVLTISVEPTIEFDSRSGMASSTRRRAIELWQKGLPPEDAEQLAKILFAFENPPGCPFFSGSQDAIGIVFPGLNRLDYDGGYWPEKITSVEQMDALDWLEEHLCLLQTGPRALNFEIHSKPNVERSKVSQLASAAELCWKSIAERDLPKFGEGVKKSFESQVTIFPEMLNDRVNEIIARHASESLGWKLAGCGGGGYLVLVVEKSIPNSIRIKIRRRKYSGLISSNYGRNQQTHITF